MLRGALWGTVCGILGACLGWTILGLGFAIRGDPSSLVVLPLVWLFTALLASPGGFLLGLPLASFLRLAAANVSSRIQFFAAAVAAGTPLGLVNLIISFTLPGFLLGQGLTLGDLRANFTTPFITAALAGGAGLGFGVALVVWSESHPPRRTGGWRGTC